MQKTEVMTLKSPPKPVDPVFMMKPNAGVVGVQTRSRIRHRLDRWAEQRKQRHEAYTDPTEMTWRRVSRTLDKILFRSFFIVVMAANIIVWAVMVTQYYTYWTLNINYIQNAWLCTLHGFKQLKFELRQFIRFFIHLTPCYFTTPRNRGGVIFSLQFVCVSVCVCVCVCVCVYTSDVFLLIKCQPNGWNDLDVVFAKWLLTALAQTLLKLVTLGQRSRSQWRNTITSSPKRFLWNLYTINWSLLLTFPPCTKFHENPINSESIYKS